MKIKTVFIYFFVSVITVHMIANFSYAVEKKNETPEETALLYFKYLNSFDIAGVESLTCADCPKDHYNYIKEIIDKSKKHFLQHYNVNIVDKNSHDYNNVECNVSIINEHNFSAYCSGYIILKNLEGDIVMKKYISNEININNDDGIYVVCPKVCM